VRGTHSHKEWTKNVIPVGFGIDPAERRRACINIGLRLTAFRRSIVGDNVTALCERIDVSRSDWLKYEAGVKAPEAVDLLKLSQHVRHFSFNYILCGRKGAVNEDDEIAARIWDDYLPDLMMTADAERLLIAVNYNWALPPIRFSAANGAPGGAA